MTVNALSSVPTGVSPQMFNPVDSPIFDDIVVIGSSIQWYDAMINGNAIAMSTALTDGTYYASQTANGCESERLEVQVLINSLNVDDLVASRFAIYPNPNDGNFNIAFDRNIGDVNIQLFDIRGRIIFNRDYDVNSNSIEVKTSYLNNGFYIVRITSDQSIVDKKLVIKN